jgi:hypothetical protein
MNSCMNILLDLRMCSTEAFLNIKLKICKKNISWKSSVNSSVNICHLPQNLHFCMSALLIVLHMPNNPVLSLPEY